MDRINARWCTLAALLVWGCGAGERRQGTEQEAEGAAVAMDTAHATPAEAVAQDSIPVYRWTAEEGSRVVGYLPGDVYWPAAVSTHGIFAWRYHEEDNAEAGDYLILEPWLLRPDRGGVSLGKSHNYTYANPQWLPGKPLLAINHLKWLILADTAGRTVRRVHLDADTSLWVHDIAVNPADGRIAAMMGRATSDAWVDPEFDLVVLGPELQRLAKVMAVSRARTEEGIAFASLSPHWLADGRIAFISYVADPNHKPDPGAPSMESNRPFLTFADLARGAVDVTEINANRIAGVTPEGYVALEYQSQEQSDPEACAYFDPRASQCVGSPAPEQIQHGNLRYSPDGRWIASDYFDGTAGIGVLRRSDNSWQPLGKGILLGWDERGALYWTEAKKQ
jgi:hypothetical protein